MRCVAVISVRNGVDYIEKCINHLIGNDIEVAVIDQSSDDGTYEICQKYKEDGLFCLKRVDYPGYFSLKDQLKEKYTLIDKLSTDWVIHQDVDECLNSPYPELNLFESIKQENKNNYNVINFNEFVFLPYNEADSFYDSEYYYFFEPFSPRLMRAWKKKESLNALESGGHILKGNTCLSPVNYHLYHYIFTSQEHALNKYGERKFTEKETKLGWHKNRLGIRREKLIFPDKSILNKLSESDNGMLNITKPWKKHFWEQEI